ncbi:MAG: hypothetical protein AAF267_03180 [Deinococcota bacterium]
MVHLAAPCGDGCWDRARDLIGHLRAVRSSAGGPGQRPAVSPDICEACQPLALPAAPDAARLPDAAVTRLLSSQLASGGFMTAEGFASQISQRSGVALNYRDVIPVVGWNDKVLRLLATLLPEGTTLPDATTRDSTVAIRVGRQRAIYEETHNFIRIYTLKAPNTVLYDWKKSAPWAHVVHFPLEVR